MNSTVKSTPSMCYETRRQVTVGVSVFLLSFDSSDFTSCFANYDRQIVFSLSASLTQLCILSPWDAREENPFPACCSVLSSTLHTSCRQNPEWCKKGGICEVFGSRIWLSVSHFLSLYSCCIQSQRGVSERGMRQTKIRREEMSVLHFKFTFCFSESF